MIEVHCQEHLEKVRAYADTLGPKIRAQFDEKYAYLENYRDGTCFTHLYWDSAPYSFVFDLLGPERDGKRELWFHGGLIYHAARSNGVGAPEYSVTLDPQEVPHWQVHT